MPETGTTNVAAQSSRSTSTRAGTLEANGVTDLLRIGEAASRSGVSERTLRYYEELGLLSPAAHSPGGNRRYGTEELDRLRRIRELQEVMGLNLEEIRLILGTEDRIAQLRTAWQSSEDPLERLTILEEGFEKNTQLRDRLLAQVERASAALAEIEERLERIRQLREELEPVRATH